MSVLIKGMEMPESCGECWFCHAVGNDKWHCRLTDKSFSSWEVGWGARNNKGENGQHPYVRRLDCPLVPVPPHGRLGDMDKLEQMFADIENAPYSGFDGTEPFYSAADAAQIIRLAPTVIPADADVSVMIGKDTKLDIDAVRTEFDSPALKMKSIVLEAS